MEHIDAHFADSIVALTAASRSPAFMLATRRASEACTACLEAGGKIMLVGNGGSAGDAQHIAGEFLCRLDLDRGPLAAIALTTDTSVLTAIGNDCGYDQVFARQVFGLARPGDVLIALSTSGRSPNVRLALEAARERGCTTIGFGGRRSAMAALCDICLEVPSDSTPIVQQIHMVAAHAICGEVERRMVSGRETMDVRGWDMVGRDLRA